MQVAVVKVYLHIHASASLKDKRRVIHSVIERLRSRYSVSAAQVDPNNSWDSATIGISIVSNDVRTVQSLLDRVLEYIETAHPATEVIDTVSETWSV